MRQTITQTCHNCRHQWPVTVEVEADVKAVTFIREEDAMCPMCSHEDENSDCWTCYESKNNVPRETI